MYKCLACPTQILCSTPEEVRDHFAHNHDIDISEETFSLIDSIEKIPPVISQPVTTVKIPQDVDEIHLHVADDLALDKSDVKFLQLLAKAETLREDKPRYQKLMLFYRACTRLERESIQSRTDQIKQEMDLLFAEPKESEPKLEDLLGADSTPLEKMLAKRVLELESRLPMKLESKKTPFDQNTLVIVPIQKTQGHNYPLNEPCAKFLGMDSGHKFLRTNGKLGNNMDQTPTSWRRATEPEIAWIVLVFVLVRKVFESI